MSRPLTRREFLRTGVIAGVAVSIAPLARHSKAAHAEQERLRPLAWDATRGAPRYRIDGIAKVTGEKLFARDFRARDLPGWPQQQAHALLLRVDRADARFGGIDLAALPEPLRPDRTVTAADLARDGLALPPFYGEDMLLPVGATPAYLGQPVALLIWRDFPRFRSAREKLRAGGSAIGYGEPTGPLQRDPWGAVRVVRIGGETLAEPDVWSPLEHGLLFPDGYREREPRWPAPSSRGTAGARAMQHAEDIAHGFRDPLPDGSRVLEREYFSQSTDTSALEPDNANGWYDAEQRKLHLVIASQSPHEVAEETARMVARSQMPVRAIDLHPCYTVGYGSKDHHAMPFYGAVAALYGDGRPVRLANDRHEQFQSALKRHSFRMRYALRIDAGTGTFQALRADLRADGGGRANFSASVALVAATAAQSIYYLPQSDLVSCAYASRAVDAGSARGYGTLQSMSAMEMLVDEVAAELRIDPIELRQRNVLRSGMRNTQGAVPGGALRAEEILAKAQAHPLWVLRHVRKLQHEAAHPGQRHGVGFACVQKDFGTGAEAAFAGVEIDPAGRIALRHVAVEIGTGMATAQALLCARWLGRPADEVHTARTDWPELPMVTSGIPWTISQAEQDRAERNPLWTPYLVTPTSASNSAFFYGHATQQAARLVFEHGLWPAALVLWSEGPGGGQLAPVSVRSEDARWVSGKLTAAGLTALPIEDVARKAHALGLVTGAVVHTFNRWQWSEAEFELGRQRTPLPIDGLALRGEPGRTRPPRAAARKTELAPPYRVIPRTRVFHPPAARNAAGSTYYTAVGTLAEVAVETASGAVSLLSHHTIVECGSPIVKELVSGQIQGGVAMGIGHALHEELPLYEDGPGNGRWNFDRYQLPRASDVAVWSQTAECLPPLSDSDPPKGMAEVTVIPVIAAIANAVASAIGARVRQLPITPERLLRAMNEQKEKAR